MVAIKLADLKQEVQKTILTAFPTDEKLVVISEQEYNRFEKLRKHEARQDLREATAKIRDNAIANGNTMTEEEVDAFMAEYKKERREKREGAAGS